MEMEILSIRYIVVGFRRTNISFTFESIKAIDTDSPTIYKVYTYFLTFREQFLWEEALRFYDIPRLFTINKFQRVTTSIKQSSSWQLQSTECVGPNRLSNSLIDADQTVLPCFWSFMFLRTTQRKSS